MRLVSASQIVLTLGLTIAAEWIFIRYTHALQNPYPSSAAPAKLEALIHFQRHSALVSAILVGCITALIGSLVSGTDTPRREVVTVLLSPVIVFGSITAFLPIAGHRPAMFAAFVVFAGLGMWLRRFGARFAILGMLVWAGVFSAFFFHRTLTESKMGWIAAELAIGTLIALLVRLTLFRHRPHLALQLMQRSMAARERTSLRLAANHLDRPNGSHQRRSSAKLLALNETSLMIDNRASLVGSEDLGMAVAHSSYLADMSISSLVHLALEPQTAELPKHFRAACASALRALADGDSDSAITLLDEIEPIAGKSVQVSLHTTQLRAAVLRVVASRAQSESTAMAPLEGATIPFIGGWLPGSLLASAQASRQPLPKWLDRSVLEAPLRSAIQLSIAMTAAIVIGDALNGARFYWAMIAVFVAFMGGSNSYENLHRAVGRVVGTIVGIFLGFAAVHLAGDHDGWTIAIILSALFVGFYLTRLAYFFFVLSITIMVSELYAQFGEYSHHLLYLRVKETAIGGVIAVVVLALVIPLRRERVFAVALGGYLDAIHAFLESVDTRSAGGNPRIDLHSELRSVDITYQTLRSVDKPAIISRVYPAARARMPLMALCDQARHAARGWSQEMAPTPREAHSCDSADNRTMPTVDSPAVHARTGAMAAISLQSAGALAQDYLTVLDGAARSITMELTILDPNSRLPLAATGSTV